MIEGAVLENEEGVVVCRLKDHNLAAVGKPDNRDFNNRTEEYENFQVFFFKHLKVLLPRRILALLGQ